MKEPAIVRMSEAHLAGVIEIELASFGMPWSRDGFLKVLNNPLALAYAAEEEGKVAGYVCALMLGLEAEILKLAVRPELRGRGIAKALNARCLAELREKGAQVVYLEVRLSNREAVGLYEGFGFRRAGLRKGYYSSPPEDALVMRLEL
jgi:ribosomal-protein-alanine N-acetyltransferase